MFWQQLLARRAQCDLWGVGAHCARLRKREAPLWAGLWQRRPAPWARPLAAGRGRRARSPRGPAGPRQAGRHRAAAPQRSASAMQTTRCSSGCRLAVGSAPTQLQLHSPRARADAEESAQCVTRAGGPMLTVGLVEHRKPNATPEREDDVVVSPRGV